MSQKELEALSDREIEKLVAVASGHNADYIERHPDNAPEYLGDFDAMMPLVFESNIDLTSPIASGCDEWLASRFYVSWKSKDIAYHKNPLRAAAIVHLLMQEENK